ncbi:hypothetical protein Ddc_00402 [Ditylenchus destructor]|nr:hypothetical protein Ddc_00402 [Ditylenchus destructor]
MSIIVRSKLSPAILHLSVRASSHDGPPAKKEYINPPEKWKYNAPVEAEVKRNWQIQTPDSPRHPGLALSHFPWSAKNPNVFFVFLLLFSASGLAMPFFLVNVQLKRTNQ